MGRSPCCDKMGVKRGPWSAQEDQILVQFIRKNGHRNWRALPKQAGLLRCGKSCRLRWVNYLRPDVKRGKFSAEEEETVIKLHNLLGNRWSAIASQLPGRTDNEIKNMWNTHLKKRLLKGGSDPTKCSNSSMEENSSISSSPDSQHTSCQMFSNMNSIGSESSTVDSASTLDWLQYDAANSSGYGEFKDLVIDETFVIQNQIFQDGERDFGSSTTTSDVLCEDNSNIKVEYFNSGYVEDDLMSCMDSKTTNLHLLWNTELESDEEDYWLNVLSQLGSPPIL